jgi:hypothetical protein
LLNQRSPKGDGRRDTNLPPIYMAKKKKVTESEAIYDAYRDGYVTFMEYFATGEGMTQEINFCWADSPDEAINKHLDRFEVKDAQSREYFRRGITVYSHKSPQAKKLFKTYFKDGDKIFNIMQSAVFDMHFKLYWNFS